MRVVSEFHLKVLHYRPAGGGWEVRGCTSSPVRGCKLRILVSLTVCIFSPQGIVEGGTRKFMTMLLKSVNR